MKLCCSWVFFFSSRRRHTRWTGDWSSDVCSSDLEAMHILEQVGLADKAHAMSRGLTQVDMRKLELARAMAAKPKLLISDEAMAGLSASEVDDILVLLS